MKFSLFPTLRAYKKENLPHDLLAGLIIAAVSIPISMGYAQIAGLPAVCGLYGSVFPIMLFALLSTSPQFIFGVDAAPAALVGASLISLGIAPGSDAAIAAVPLITLFTALWLLLFYTLKAGKLVNYISSPVMGGFITGICCTIILMQLPKLMGGSAGTGELFELMEHLFHSLKAINLPSLILGSAALAVLLVGKRLFPRFPMAIAIMAAGAALSLILPLERWGVAMLSSVERGLPPVRFPSLSALDFSDALGASFPVAIVIMAETLLAENSMAVKNGYRLNDNREILAFSIGNLAAALTGCCPINGSVSRSTLGEQYGAKTQLTGFIAGLIMMAVLLFATDFISLLPVPVLTAIVISALMSACEFHLARLLWKLSKKEFYIFSAAFLSVLVLGTIYGVLIGVALSFTAVIIRSAMPPRCFLGLSPGHEELLDLSRYRYAHSIKGAVIYRFSSDLFFANAAVFQRDIEEAVKEDTQAVIVDCSGIGALDITAAERLEAVYKAMKERGIKFYLSGHIAALNDILRQLGLGYMIEEGAVRISVEKALAAAGFEKPYPLDGTENIPAVMDGSKELAAAREFVWAFGKDADAQIEKLINRRIEQFKATGDESILNHSAWSGMDGLDEDEWLEHVELHIAEIARITHHTEDEIAEGFERRRMQLHKRIAAEHPELAERFINNRRSLDEHLKATRPLLYEKILRIRERID